MTLAQRFDLQNRRPGKRDVLLLPFAAALSGAAEVDIDTGHLWDVDPAGEARALPDLAAWHLLSRVPAVAALTHGLGFLVAPSPQTPLRAAKESRWRCCFTEQGAPWPSQPSAVLLFALN